VTARRARARDGIVRVATFNIRHGAAHDEAVRPFALARACATLDPDILGLQEVEGGRRRSWYVDEGRLVATWMRARYASGPAMRRGRWRTYGNGLVARGRISDVEIIELPRGPGREPRTAMLAKVAVARTTMWVAVTHLQHRPARLRHFPSDAPDQLRTVIAALAARPRPRVLLGDLNLQPDVAAPILEAAGLRVVEHGPTYPADAPRIRLDYVAVDGLSVRAAWVASPAPVSDHRAVVVDLVP